MKSAWKLTQGLDWEQPLFCSKICELVRYYEGKPRAARLSGHHHNSLLAAPPRASSTHKYITIAHRFRAKETALSLGVYGRFDPGHLLYTSELGYVLEYYFFCLM